MNICKACNDDKSILSRLSEIRSLSTKYKQVEVDS